MHTRHDARGPRLDGAVTSGPPHRTYRMVARAEKREQTRRGIVAAMKEALMTNAYPSIRVADLADAAGVSAQTLHTHFETKEALFLTAVAELGEELLARRRRVEPGDIPGLVRELVKEYERYGDVNWALLPLEREIPAVAAALNEGRVGHRTWLQETFGSLLPADAGTREKVLLALYAATDVGTWKLLRRDLRLSQSRTRSVMESLVSGALGAAASSG